MKAKIRESGGDVNVEVNGQYHSTRVNVVPYYCNDNNRLFIPFQKDTLLIYNKKFQRPMRES